MDDITLGSWALVSHERCSLKELCFMPDEVVADLITKAEPEEWTPKSIRHYLQDIFVRVCEQSNATRADKSPCQTLIGFKRESTKEYGALVWNSKLFSANQSFLYALMVPNHRQEATQKWVLRRFVTAAELGKPTILASYLDGISTAISKMNLPHHVTFWDGQEKHIYYDPSIPIHFDNCTERFWAENEARLPATLRKLSPADLTQRFKGTQEDATLRVQVTPRLLVPQYFTDKRKLRGAFQMLMPCSFDSTDLNRVDCVLVLDRTIDKNLQGETFEYYSVNTVLTPKMAYENARAIQKVDQEWLRTSAAAWQESPSWSKPESPSKPPPGFPRSPSRTFFSRNFQHKTNADNTPLIIDDEDVDNHDAPQDEQVDVQTPSHRSRCDYGTKCNQIADAHHVARYCHPGDSDFVRIRCKFGKKCTKLGMEGHREGYIHTGCFYLKEKCDTPDCPNIHFGEPYFEPNVCKHGLDCSRTGDPIHRDLFVHRGRGRE